MINVKRFFVLIRGRNNPCSGINKHPPYWANNIIKDFHIRVQWAQIDSKEKELTVHFLRKCCFQNWANSLPMNVVKSLTAHADISTTEKYYSMIDDAHLSKAKETMNDLLKTESKKLDTETADLKMTFSGDFVI
jgi:integrase